MQEEGVEGREGRKGRRSGNLVRAYMIFFFIYLFTIPHSLTYIRSSNSYPSALLLSYKIPFIAHEEH